MANFRGLTYFFLRTATLALGGRRRFDPFGCGADSDSDLLEAGAADRILDSAATKQFDRAFANTVLFALLVSYHLNPHDLSLLLLPMVLLLHRMLTQTPRLSNPARWITLGLLGILFLPPLHLWALTAGAYDVVGIPVLLLFVASTAIGFTTQATSPGKATTIQG